MYSLGLDSTILHIDWLGVFLSSLCVAKRDFFDERRRRHLPVDTMTNVKRLLIGIMLVYQL